jgi:hypothetical protein
MPVITPSYPAPRTTNDHLHRHRGSRPSSRQQRRTRATIREARCRSVPPTAHRHLRSNGPPLLVGGEPCRPGRGSRRRDRVRGSVCRRPARRRRRRPVARGRCAAYLQYVADQRLAMLGLRRALRRHKPVFGFLDLPDVNPTRPDSDIHVQEDGATSRGSSHTGRT